MLYLRHKSRSLAGNSSVERAAGDSILYPQTQMVIFTGATALPERIMLTFASQTQRVVVPTAPLPTLGGFVGGSIQIREQKAKKKLKREPGTTTIQATGTTNRTVTYDGAPFFFFKITLDLL